MTPTEYVARTADAIGRVGSPVNLVLDPMSAWCLIGVMQLALRHPEMGTYPRQLAGEVERVLVDLLARQSPDLRALAEMGHQRADQVVAAERRIIQ